MRLDDLLRQGRFVVTAELSPPKGIDLRQMLADAELLRGRVAALNVPDQRSSVMQLGSLAACHILKELGLEPIYQLTCRDRNRIALQSDLLSAAALGIENVLCLTGDYVSLGDHPDAKPVFDLDAVSLLQAASTLEAGRDLAGKELSGAPAFCKGAVVSPGAEPLEPQLLKMEKKVWAGAQFFQTPACFEPERLARFVERAAHLGVPVLAGVTLLKSAGMARFLDRNVPGVHVPEALIAELERAPDRPRASVEIAARLVRAARELCQGVHVMALGWERRVPEVLDAAGL